MFGSSKEITMRCNKQWEPTFLRVVEKGGKRKKEAGGEERWGGLVIYIPYGLGKK